MSSKFSSSPNFCCSFYISKNFQPGLNSDDARVILIIKIPITVSKSYAREGAGRERKERKRERGAVFSCAIHSLPSNERKLLWLHVRNLNVLFLQLVKQHISQNDISWRIGSGLSSTVCLKISTLELCELLP